MPAAASAMTPADSAIATAPSTPAATPAPIQRSRPGTPRVAANTTLTTSAASRTSRKTSMAMPSIDSRLFRDQRALRRFLVEIAEEWITARLERADEDRDLPLRRHDLFAVELVAFEFLGRRILVLDDELDLLSRRHRQLRGDELVLAEDQPHIGVLSQGRQDAEQEAAGEDEYRYPHRWRSSETNGNSNDSH